MKGKELTKPGSQIILWREKLKVDKVKEYQNLLACSPLSKHL